MSPEDRKELDELNALMARVHTDDMKRNMRLIRARCNRMLKAYATVNVGDLPPEERDRFQECLGVALLIQAISEPAVVRYMEWVISQRGGGILPPEEYRSEVMKLLGYPFTT